MTESTAMAFRLCSALLAATLVAPASADAPDGGPKQDCLSDQLVEMINSRDAQAFAHCIDGNALAARISSELDLSTKDRKDFATGVVSKKSAMAEGFMGQMGANRARAKLAPRKPGAPANELLIRLDLLDENGDLAGYNYLLFVGSDAGRIEDWYSHAQAIWASGVARQFAAMSMRDGGLFAQMFGRIEIDQDTLQHIKEFVDHMLKQRNEDALKALRTLPEPFRKTQMWAALQVSLAVHLDEATYRDSLDQLARGFGDKPELQLMLVDHYFFKQEYDNAVDAIARFEARVVEDSATNYLKCNALILAERMPEARQACARSTALEQDNKAAWWSLVTIGLRTRDIVLTLDTLSAFEEQFDMAFDPDQLAALDEYRWMSDHPEFAVWAGQRR